MLTVKFSAFTLIFFLYLAKIIFNLLSSKNYTMAVRKQGVYNCGKLCPNVQLFMTKQIKIFFTELITHKPSLFSD